MNVDICIFGEPNEFSMTRSIRDKSYAAIFDNYYSRSIIDGGRQMFVEKKPSGRVFYTFCVGGDGRAFKNVRGRDGSFFGISLITRDQEFADPKKVAKMLNNVYETAVKGAIIQDNGNNKKYIMDKDEFESAGTQKFITDAMSDEASKGYITTDEILKFKYNAADKNNYMRFSVGKGDAKKEPKKEVKKRY